MDTRAHRHVYWGKSQPVMIGRDTKIDSGERRWVSKCGRFVITSGSYVLPLVSRTYNLVDAQGERWQLDTLAEAKAEAEERVAVACAQCMNDAADCAANRFPCGLSGHWCCKSCNHRNCPRFVGVGNCQKCGHNPYAMEATK